MSDGVVDAFWRFHRLSTSGDREDRLASEEYFWAEEEVSLAIRTASPGVVDLISSLADAAPDDMALAALGAGPLEDLIHGKGSDFADEIEQAAIANERFLRALRCVWFGSSLDDDLRKRLQRFGPPL